MLNDLGVVGVPEEDWEAKCQLKCVWRKMLWEFSHPGQESRPVRAFGRRGQQPAVQYAERYSLPFPQPAAAAVAEGVQPVLVGANSSSHQGFAKHGGISSTHGSISLGLQLNSPLGVHAVASGFSFMLQCFMWPVVYLYEGWPYGGPAWGCVTPVHQGSCAAWS